MIFLFNFFALYEYTRYSRFLEDCNAAITEELLYRLYIVICTLCLIKWTVNVRTIIKLLHLIFDFGILYLVFTHIVEVCSKSWFDCPLWHFIMASWNTLLTLYPSRSTSTSSPFLTSVRERWTWSCTTYLSDLNISQFKMQITYKYMKEIFFY